MANPLPPTQQQAEEAQRSRLAAEIAALSLFESTEQGAGSGEDEESTLHDVKIAAILTALSIAIVASSFRHPKDRTKSLLIGKLDHDRVAEAVLPDAAESFQTLASSELQDDQKAVVWATFAYSRVADEIATVVNSGEVPHAFTGLGFELRKIWISRSDSRVRPLHAKLHGRAVPTSDDFWRWPHTGQRLRWPGDIDAPPEAVIGCRCVCLLTWATQDAVSDTIRKIVEHTTPR